MSKCICYHCERAGYSLHDRYTADFEINDLVESLMLDMLPNPRTERRAPGSGTFATRSRVATASAKRNA
jgi:hypothetical protein